MKRQITFLFILFFTRLAIGQSWVQLSDFPSSERDDGVSFVIGNKSYCGTGFKVGWITTGDFYSFDMNLEEWSSISPMPIGEERQYACAFSNQNLGYVFGGVNSSGTALNDLWAYDTLANNWTEKNSKPGIGLAGATVFKINDTAYFIGGANASTTASSEVWAYCITNDSWVQKNNFLIGGRWRASGASVNGKGYLLFGKNENEKFCNELYEYNPSSDTWSEKSAFPSIGRVYSTLQSVSNNLIAFAGIDTFTNCYNDCWRYNVSQDVWQQLTSLPSFGRKGGIGFSNGTSFYYTIGIDQQNTRLKETWKASNVIGISELTNYKTPIFYPNPANSILNFEIPPTIFKNDLNIIIYDVLGNVKLNQKINNEFGNLNISEFESGIYFIYLKDTNTVYTIAKFVKEK